MHDREFYMHTLDGKPAFFDGDQVCFAAQGGYHRSAQRLCTDLHQIKREQLASERWRREQGFNTRFRSGYIRVRLPEAARE